MMSTTQPVEATTQHIWCSTAISKKMADVFTGFILSQIQNKVPIAEYVVYLSTLGGDPFSGIDLYNFVKSMSQKTTVYNMGNVHSAGVPFFLSFEHRFGVPECTFVIHQTTLSGSSLPERFNVFDLDRQRSNLSAIDETTQKIILNETRRKATKPLTAESIKEAALRSTTYFSQEAQDRGFLDREERPKLPDGGILYLTDQYLSTLPG